MAEIVSRICGICPVSHQMTSLMAVEDALGVKVSPRVVKLRRLLALAQWIQSHVLHIYMLAAPDFLGAESVVALASIAPDAVKRALRLKRLGNDLTAAIGGREVHPVTPVVGGFTAIPSEATMEPLRKRLELAMDDAMETVALVSTFQVPEFSWDCEHVALRGDGEYPVNRGRLVSSRGLNLEPKDYRKSIRERQVEHSSALHSTVEGRGSFLVGPLARLNLNLDNLGDAARTAMCRGGVDFPNKNPFYSAMARAIELVQAIDDSMKLIDSIDFRGDEDRSHAVTRGQGYAITEAPRGTLYHAYRVDRDGVVEFADIVTPTAHNVMNMEEDLRRFVPTVIDLPQDELTLKCEMIIRNYDPCISCSAHFLKVRVKR
ncbi:MAG: Ni/Fe hydrogenase subunit alpha [Bacillota bacterium]